MPLSTHAGAAELHAACSYRRHAHVQARCSTALSCMLITSVRMLGVPTLVYTTTSRLSQAIDRFCKRAQDRSFAHMHEPHVISSCTQHAHD
eukprot:6181821-Pleurochrysis_carterae.AAC.2